MLNKSIPKFKNKQERIEYWRTIYKARLASNLTNVKFCVQHNISEAALYRWVRYFKKYQSNDKKSSKPNLVAVKRLPKAKQSKHNPTFMPVTVTDLGTHQLAKSSNNYIDISKSNLSCIKLLFPNGVKLIFKQVVHVDLLMQLITARY